MFDVNGTSTSDASLANTYKYNVKLAKVINGFSTNALSVKMVSTGSTFDVVAPNKGGIQSSAPFSGNYAITCSDSQGVSHTSWDIAYNTGPTWITNVIDRSIPFLSGKVDAVFDYRYTYWENGISFILHFVGLDYDQPACTIGPSSTSATPLEGNDPVATVEVVQSYGGSIMFEPVHLEFLTSDAQSPQVLVIVDGIAALCADHNCDYEYTR
jgi:hypothetical protein